MQGSVMHNVRMRGTFNRNQLVLFRTFVWTRFGALADVFYFVGAFR
jgi:hypothetical protein